MNVHDKMAAARLRVISRAPYVSSMLFALVPRETDQLPTMAVTPRAVMYWNPAFVAERSVAEVASVLIHEIWHLLRAHAARAEAAGASEREVWNIAADAEINDDLEKGGWDLPCEPPTPERIGAEPGLTAEAYYRHLMSQAQRAKKSGGAGAGAGEGEGDEGGGQGGEPMAGSGRCGGCAGNPEDLEEGEGEGAGAGGDEAGAERGGRSPAEIDQIRTEVAHAVQQEIQKGRGTVPSGLERWASEQVAPPKIPWQKRLAVAARRAVAYRPGAVDYHYRRPSRRQAALGYGRGAPILPGMHRPVPKVAVAFDTSGSMGPDELSAGLSEVDGVLSAAGAEATFLACDAAVHAVREVRTWRDAAKQLKGGGGTSFVPVFEEVEKMRPRPDLLVFVTDGMGDAPAVPPPGVAVIWLIVGSHCVPFVAGNHGRKVDWGEVIFLEDE